MKKRQHVGLLAAGKLTDSPLVRMWALRECLGPVRSSSFRIASRISNILRAGHAVADYQEFEKCTLILISVPDSMAPKFVAELASQPLNWKSKAVVMCSALLGSSVLDSLGCAGASVGSLGPIPGFEDRWFLMEGDKRIEGQIARLIDSRRTRLTVIRPCHKAMYLSAVSGIGSTVMPVLIAASDSLRRAGVPVTESQAILEKQVERSMRLYFRAGLRADARRLRTQNSLVSTSGN